MKMNEKVGVYSVKIDVYSFKVLATNLSDAVELALGIAAINLDQSEGSCDVTSAALICELDHRADYPSVTTLAWVCGSCGVEVDPEDPEISSDEDGYWCAACVKDPAGGA